LGAPRPGLVGLVGNPPLHAPQIDMYILQPTFRLTMQIWDLDLFGNEFIGGIRMDLRKIHKPAQSSKECRVKDESKIKYINLFKTRNAKGWWPCTVEEDDPENPGEKIKVCKGGIRDQANHESKENGVLPRHPLMANTLRVAPSIQPAE
jgi:hypothetical protein